MKKILIACFIILALVQWIIPGMMIRQKTMVLKNGTAYKFQAQPVDPVDPFKGRYVMLSFTENSVRIKNENNKYHYGQDIYIYLDTTSAGYAKIKEISTDKYQKYGDYLKAKVGYTSYDRDSITTVTIKYPFEEYYMEESKAPKTETIFRTSVIAPDKKSYALVRIYKGDAVMEDLIINDRPVKELLLDK